MTVNKIYTISKEGEDVRIGEKIKQLRLSKLMTHKYRAEDIAVCMKDSVERKDGFIKSCFYF